MLDALRCSKSLAVSPFRIQSPFISVDSAQNSSEIEDYPVRSAWEHRAPTHSPLPLLVAKTDKNNLNEEITPLLARGIGERSSQTLSKFRTCSALASMWTPPVNESAELTRRALQLILYSEPESGPIEFCTWTTCVLFFNFIFLVFKEQNVYYENIISNFPGWRACIASIKI